MGSMKLICFSGVLHCRDAIVTWIKKKTGPAVYNITTAEDAEKVLTSEDKVVLAYLNSLVVYYSNTAYILRHLQFSCKYYRQLPSLSP